MHESVDQYKNTAILTILNSPIYEHGISFCVFKPYLNFLTFYSFQYTNFAFLFKFIPNYLILFDAIVA